MYIFILFFPLVKQYDLSRAELCIKCLYIFWPNCGEVLTKTFNTIGIIYMPLKWINRQCLIWNIHTCPDQFQLVGSRQYMTSCSPVPIAQFHISGRMYSPEKKRDTHVVTLFVAILFILAISGWGKEDDGTDRRESSVPWVPKPKMTVLARTNSYLSGSQTQRGWIVSHMWHAWGKRWMSMHLEGRGNMMEDLDSNTMNLKETGHEVANGSIWFRTGHY
jgi:hypothetical protein